MESYFFAMGLLIGIVFTNTFLKDKLKTYQEGFRHGFETKNQEKPYEIKPKEEYVPDVYPSESDPYSLEEEEEEDYKRERWDD